MRSELQTDESYWFNRAMDAERLLRGMLSIEDSVTQGQERELRDKWIPAAREYLRTL